MTFISEIFGYVLNYLYIWLNNYGIAIILFSVLLRLLLLPITIKQQKTMKKSAIIQEKTKQIQFKYKNDPQKLNEETMKLYKEEKFSPFSGCLSGIIQIVLVLAVFWLVSQPLTYMRRVNSDETLKNIVEEYKTELSSSNNKKSSYIEIAVISKVEEDYKQIIKDIDNYDEYVQRINQENEEIKKKNDENLIKEETNQENESTENSENEKIEELKVLTKEELEQRKENLEKLRINMELFGLDLSKVPTQDLKDWKVYVIPGLYVLTSFISIKLTTSKQNKKKKEEIIVNNNEEKKDPQDELMDSMGNMSNTMLYMMPIMSISIAAIAPLGLALYWLVSNILIILERLVITKFTESKGEGENE